MNRLLRHSARWLFSAGVFTLGGLALPPSAHAGEPAQAVGAASTATGQVQREAMKVEIALLGDPITYALPLQIRTQSDTIELHGIISSEAARRRILDLARRSCYLSVADRMCLAGSARADAFTLQRDARDRLVKQLGAQADAIRLEIHADGRIQLTGQVRTIEDKWQVSRSLQGLPRCAALVNELAVTGSSARQSFTLITHGPEATGSLRTTGASTTQTAKRIGSPATAVLPSGLPVGPRTVQGTVHGYASSLYPVDLSEPLPPVERSAGPAVVVPAGPPGNSGLTRVSAQTVEQPQTQSVEWPPAYRVAPAAVATPLPAGSIYQSRPLENLARWSVARPQVNTLVPAAPLVSAPVAVKPPFQTETIAPVVAVEPAKPMGKPHPVSVPSSPDLLCKVKAACGKLASTVRVEMAADGFLAVHVYSAPGKEQLVTAKLFTVSELMAPGIRLHVHLAQ